MHIKCHLASFCPLWQADVKNIMADDNPSSYQASHSGLSKKKILLLLLGATVVIGIFYLLSAKGGPLSAIKATYPEIYTLVNDKISMSAPIQINLPKFDRGESSVSFEPSISGEWVPNADRDVMVYQPDKKLEVGKYYSVTYSSKGGRLTKDFLADEDPSVVGILPVSGSEADEASSITIVFNRPMVPLTTLSELEKKDLPVSITPPTAGKWKWISTRNLQFIPEKGLVASAHYTVKIVDGLKSVDGLTVKPFTHEFTTRPLRFISVDKNQVLYNQPINFRFNQPVDLDQTAARIRLSNSQTRQSVAFDAEYGKRIIYDKKGNASKIEDRSVIALYPSVDRFGRSHLWDFKTTYTAAIDKTYPVAGDIIYEQPIGTVFYTTDIVKSFTAKSERTNLAEPELFDPQGSVTIQFYEDIDLSASNIEIKGSKSVKYGEKCAEQKGGDRYRYPCEKVPDQSALVIGFNPDSFKTQGEAVPVKLKKIINKEGLQLNAAPFDLALKVYPQFKILRTFPGGNTANGSVSKLKICSNSPIAPLGGKEFYKAVTTDGYLIFGRWDHPYKQTSDVYESPRCETGEYVSNLYYGLIPNTPYELNLNVNDVFDQKASERLTFTTENAELYLRFHALDRQYNVTTPGKTKLTFAVENFDKVYVHICKTDPVSMVQYLQNRPSNSVPGQSLQCLEETEDVIAMPPKLWVNNYFQIDVAKYFFDPRGQYIVTLTHPKYRAEWGDKGQRFERSFLSVTNLAVGEKKIQWGKYDELPELTKSSVDSTSAMGEIYWVSRIGDLSPVVNASVTVLQDQGYERDPQVADIGKTDASGIARLPLIKDVVGAAITSGGDSAVVSSWGDNLNWASTAYAGNKIYIYTDRPIYRPGQEVNIKGIYRLSFDGMFEIFNEKPVDIRITDSRGNEILKQQLPVSKYGTFSTKLKLPDNAALGGYWISVKNQSGHFEVEEYKGAAFEATAKTPKDEYIAGDTVDVDVVGKYYFGVPLEGATVRYSFTAQNYYFDRYQDEYFSFGGGWYGCYDCGYGDSFLKSGETTLDVEGLAKITEKLDFKQLFKDQKNVESKIIVFHATIQDKQGNSISTQTSFIVHRGEFYLGAATEPYFAAVNKPVLIKLKTVDTKGEPTGRGSLKLTVNRVEWKSYKRQEVDGDYYNRPERVMTPVLEKTVSTNRNGDYSEKFTPKDPGEYEINVATIDGRGNDISAVGHFYIYGEGSVSIRPTNNATLDITANKRDLKVGDKAQFIFQSPYKSAKALITLERGRIFEYKVVNVDRNVFEDQFPITDAMVPNIYASVLLLSSDPEIKFGQVQYQINKETRTLNIDVKSDKNSYLPGEEVSLHITTTDNLGKAVPAEISVAVADLSVLALKGNPKKNPLLFFYSGFPLMVTTGSNVKNILTEAEIPTGTKGGGGGDAAEDLAKKQRGEFRDTAYWQAEVTTDKNGTAVVRFTLPDNITRWQVESLGVTEDSKFGVKYNEITAQKNIMLVPLRPRFVIPGDEFEIGAQVFNQTAAAQTLEVSYRSDSLKINQGDDSYRQTIKAGETATFYFKVKAPDNILEGKHAFTLSARNDGFDDTVNLYILINPNITYEAVATANSTNSKSASEYVYIPEGVLATRGGVTIKTSATLAVFLSDALKYMVQYPYGCTEQMLSKLSSLAIVKRGLNLPNVGLPAAMGAAQTGDKFALPPVTFEGQTYTAEQVIDIGLKKIYDNQNYDGGFTYFKGLKSEPYLTMEVVRSLSDIRDAGYAVDSRVLNNAANYLYTYFSAKGISYWGTDTYVMAAYAISRLNADSAALRYFMSAIEPYLTNAYISERSSSGILSYLAMLSLRQGWGPAMTERIYTSLQNRVTVDSRGAYVKAGGSDYNWQFYETPIKNTALFVKALSKRQKDFVETDKLLRWILASRAKDGAWGSTQNTIAVIDAFTDYLAWKRETESSFSLKLDLDGNPLAEWDFNKDTVLSIYEKFIPINSFSQNSMHTLTFAKENRNDLQNNFYYDMGLKYYLPAEKVPPRDEGIAITRELFGLEDKAMEKPRGSAKVGEVLKGKLTIITAKARHAFAVEDFIPAGFELVNFNLATEDKASIEQIKGRGSVGESVAEKGAESNGFWSRITAPWSNIMAAGRYYDNGYGEADDYNIYEEGRVFENNLRPDFKELRDDRLFMFKEYLPAGAYTYEYYIRATTAGTFRYLPAVASEMYFPENFGRTGGALFEVTR